MATPRATLAAKSELARRVMIAARDVLAGHDIGVTVLVHDSWLGLGDDAVEVAEATSLPPLERALLTRALGRAAD